MLNGLMMESQLTITSIMEFADRAHPNTEIVSITGSNDLHRYTYRDAFRRTRQLANALRVSGVEEGDRIATLAWNDYRHLELYYGISCIGAVCHTINPRLFPEQIEYIVNHAQDKLLFTDPMFLPLLEAMQDKLGSVEQVVVLTDDAQLPKSGLTNICSYDSYISVQPDQFEWPQLTETKASALCYTSGTTGNPKGVLYSHRSTVLHAYAAALPDSLNLSSRDAVLPVVPMFHVLGWGLPYAAPLVGAKLVLPGPKMGDGETLANLMNGEGVTLSAGVPTVWMALLDYLENANETLSQLERVVVGGAACPVSIMEGFANRHGVEVLHAWGMTETSPLGTMNTLKGGMSDLSAAELAAIRVKQGRAVCGIDLRIVAADGKEQPWDGASVGELRVRGPWVSSGYYDPADTAAQTTSHDDEGWFCTGDVASIDSYGFMQITDRTKDVIKSGGEWISSIELENAAVDHPGVAEAAVIGMPHPKWTERPLLLIVRTEGTDYSAGEILASLEEKVASWWIPDDAVFIDELPHTATGKISKKDLRAQFAHYRFPEQDG